MLTWLMVLVNASLQASLPSSAVDELIIDLWVTITDPYLEDYFQAQLPHHIQGWTSYSKVTRIRESADKEWRLLEVNEEHPPGFIPVNDRQSILDFLYWLLCSTDQQFRTSSGDVYYLAQTLKVLGIPLLQPIKSNEPTVPGDENKLNVILYMQLMTLKTGPNHISQRKGMRVPLGYMEECVSPWPARSDKMEPRDAFRRGQSVGKYLVVALGISPDAQYAMAGSNLTSIYYRISTKDELSKTRCSNRDLDEIAKKYFPFVTSKLVTELEVISTCWKPLNQNINWQAEVEVKAYLQNDTDFFGLLQSFIVGYYYESLMQLINISQFSVREACGSWGWWDFEVLQVICELWHSSTEIREKDPEIKWCRRFAVLKVIAYLFAGAEYGLIRRLGNTAIGVIAKLCLVPASMLGKSTNTATAGQLHLLDIDGTCIPNREGVIISGDSRPLQTNSLGPTIAPVALNAIDMTGIPKDFTVHIEPDYKGDRDACLIAYRDSGRLVQLMSPVNVDFAVVKSAQNTENQQQQPNSVEVSPYRDVHLVPIHSFHGGNIVTRPDANDGLNDKIWEKPLLVPTKNLPNARICLTTIWMEFLNWKEFIPRKLVAVDSCLRDAFILFDQDARPVIFAREELRVEE